MDTSIKQIECLHETKNISNKNLVELQQNIAIMRREELPTAIRYGTAFWTIDTAKAEQPPRPGSWRRIHNNISWNNNAAGT